MDALHTRSVEELRSRIANGDRSAGAEYLERLRPALRIRVQHGIGRSSLLRRTADEDDILQECAARLDRSIESGSIKAGSVSELDGYIKTIIRHVQVDILRQSRCPAQGGAVFGEIVDQQSRFGQRAGSDRDQLRRLMALIRSPSDRELLLLLARGATLAQIATHAGVSVSTLKKRWSKLRERLDSALKAGGASARRATSKRSAGNGELCADSTPDGDV